MPRNPGECGSLLQTGPRNGGTSKEHLQRAVDFLLGEGYLEEHDVPEHIREKLEMKINSEIVSGLGISGQLIQIVI